MVVKNIIHAYWICCCSLDVANTNNRAAAFVPPVSGFSSALKEQKQPGHPTSSSNTFTGRSMLWNIAGDDDDGNDPENLSSPDIPQERSGEEGKSLLDQINSILDTPILDANDRSDQGPLAETLKRFVRREPQLASVTFSAVVVAFMFLLVRLFNFISYGI